jgi:hypothetical protein
LNYLCLNLVVKGYSAHFNGTQMMTINNHVDFTESSDMSLSFWIYLLEDSTGNWRTLIHKGDSIQELTPTIMFWPKERRLHVRVSTEIFWNEGLESRALINMKQWVFVTVIASGQMLQLYINGNLDNQVILRGKVKFNNGNFHIGKDPWHPGVKCFLDELKIYKTALRSKEIEAEASISNPLIGPTYTTLGCENCPFVQALSSCQEKYHLCSYAELYSGGYLVARRNGWFKFNTEVWARESQTELQKLSENTGNEVGNPNILKMALCCSDF